MPAASMGVCNRPASGIMDAWQAGPPSLVDLSVDIKQAHPMSQVCTCFVKKRERAEKPRACSGPNAALRVAALGSEMLVQHKHTQDVTAHTYATHHSGKIQRQ